VWALDLTQLSRSDCDRQVVLGVVDHGSRRLLRLRSLTRKCTWTLLGHLCLAIAEFGKPVAIRTDNECMFTSRLWQHALAWAASATSAARLGAPGRTGASSACSAC
jgi:hypothetical protein